ncbi:MAG: hypothetical protein ACPGED_06535 [Flavobacteriales bacterium]
MNFSKSSTIGKLKYPVIVLGVLLVFVGVMNFFHPPSQEVEIESIETTFYASYTVKYKDSTGTFVEFEIPETMVYLNVFDDSLIDTNVKNRQHTYSVSPSDLDTLPDIKSLKKKYPDVDSLDIGYKEEKGFFYTLKGKERRGCNEEQYLYLSGLYHQQQGVPTFHGKVSWPEELLAFPDTVPKNCSTCKKE